MKTAVCPIREFKVGTNWTLLFRVKNIDLTGAGIQIVIRFIGGQTAVFDSSDPGTFTATVAGNTSGVFSITRDGADTIILFVVSYKKTEDALVGTMYEYDMQNNTGDVYLEGEINVTRNK